MPVFIPPPLALYVHLPWCVRKCPYCDFNSHAQRGELPFADYVDALIRDIEYDLPMIWGRVIHSIFFGGGTPSLFAPDYIDRFLQESSARLNFAPNVEVTLETNPGTAEYGKFEHYRTAGVNRISFGVQSFTDTQLHTLGRIHNSEQARNAIKHAQDSGFSNINIDLMYALPQQTMAQAEYDLHCAFALQPAHISYYQLTLEPNTLFFIKPPKHLPNEDLAWDIQEHGQKLLKQAGYQHYEISAYAREGYQCAHNLNYWRFGDYLGIGAGAHSKISNAQTANIMRQWKQKHPRTYMQSAGNATCIGGSEIISRERLPFEYMLNVLRLHEGFDLQDFESRTGIHRAVLRPRLNTAEQNGWLLRKGSTFIPTDEGRRLSNNLIELFLD